MQTLWNFIILICAFYGTVTLLILGLATLSAARTTPRLSMSLSTEFLEDTMTTDTQDYSGFFQIPVPVFDKQAKVGPDPEWRSDRSTDLLRSRIKASLTGNVACLVRYDVTPLYESGDQRHYRVTIFERDLEKASWVKSFKIWKTFHVVTEGVDVVIVRSSPPIR